jgi:GT2 family glycosyltransferase
MLTNGYLPIAPFEHSSPTAIGAVACDRAGSQPSWIGTTHTGLEVDVLLLARVHGDPVGFVYLDIPPGSLDPSAVASAAWSQVGAAIVQHVARHRCGRAPTSAEDLFAGVGDGDASCSAAHPVDPGLSTALIIPSAGRAEQLARCLESLKVLDPRNLEILVVDNKPGEGNTRSVVEAAARSLTGLRYLEEPLPGSSVARNRGIAQSKAEIVAFTDDDVTVDAGFLDWLVAPFADANVGCVTGMVLPLELQTPAQKQFELYAGFSKGVVGRTYDLGEHSASDRMLYPYWGGVFGSGNSMAFRRELLIAAGGFDPALGAGSRALAGADIEALSAVVLSGSSLVYEPRSICWHEHRRDDGNLSRQLFNYGVGFTAILTKALLRDRRFPGAVARSIPIMLELRRRARTAGSKEAGSPGLPSDLASLQRNGMLRGPMRYIRSRQWARRLELGSVITGG